MSDEEDQIDFIYGDDYGEIDTEVLGSHQGTTTRKMEIPHRLAVDLYEELHEQLSEATDRYLVYGTNGFTIENVCVVEANDEGEAVRKACEDTYVPSNSAVHKLDELIEYGDVWAAIR